MLKIKKRIKIFIHRKHHIFIILTSLDTDVYSENIFTVFAFDLLIFNKNKIFKSD